jgi:branched-chain amino acid transport system ATP-binding protein
MSVRENLEMGLYASGRQAKSSEAFDRVYTLFPILQERRAQAGGTLSGGQQQMLAIGRALMTRPTILMLDEPSMGLAPNLVERIFEIVVEINKQGTTVLLIEQNAHMALSIANRGYVIESGRIVLEDSAKALLGNDQVRKAYLGEE